MTTEAFDKFTGTRDFMMKKIAIADNFHSLKLFEGDFAVMQLADTVWNAAKASSEQRIAELEAEVKAYQDEQVAYTMKVVVERTELQAHINRLLKHIK